VTLATALAWVATAVHVREPTHMERGVNRGRKREGGESGGEKAFWGKTDRSMCFVVAPGGAVRDGRPRRHYSVQPAGLRALNQAQPRRTAYGPACGCR
jgi:hypothetical protein